MDPSKSSQRKEGARAPRSDTSPRPWRARLGALALAGALLYLGVVVAVAVALPVLGDRFWVATLVLFGPRWVIALPLLVLVPAALLWRRVALAPLAAAAGVVVFPILGFVLPIADLLRDEEPGDFRLVTFNAGSRALDIAGLTSLARAARLDAVVLVECKASAEELGAAFPKWAVHVDEGLCLASRFPVTDIAARDRLDAWKRYGSGAMIRYTIELPAAPPERPAAVPVNLVQVHLATPRHGLEALRSDKLKGIPEHDRNVEERAWESDLARQWTDAATHPVIVAGDFNMPVESAIYRRFWGGFNNAFSSVGFGFGGTKMTRLFSTRIDHVLTGPGWEPERAWVGPDLGSDHLPLLAELRLTKP